MKTREDKKVINAWALYDWANSVFPLVITSSIFPIYYGEVTKSADGLNLVNFFGFEVRNTVIYDYTLSFAFLIVAAITPLLSGIADYSGKKRSFLVAFCTIGAISCSGMYLFDASNLIFGLSCLLFASIGFSGSIVFYNAYLPEIAPPERHDAISAKGYALGYIGSSLLLMSCLAMIMFYDAFGFESKSAPTRLAFLLTGIWWILFGFISIKGLPVNLFNRNPGGKYITSGYRELLKVWNELRHNKMLVRYLLAFFVYNMAAQTVLYIAALFGTIELELESQQLIITVLILQFLAIAGSYFFSWVSSKKGNIFGLGCTIIIWIGICFAAYFIPKKDPLSFYALAVFFGFTMGGIQSLSRSTYAKILPETVDHASYFSFFEVCQKAGVVLGMATFAWIEHATGNIRLSILSLFIYFLAGFILLLRVPRDTRIMPISK